MELSARPDRWIDFYGLVVANMQQDHWFLASFDHGY